jgi:hypothetical protein
LQFSQQGSNFFHQACIVAVFCRFAFFQQFDSIAVNLNNFDNHRQQVCQIFSHAFNVLTFGIFGGWGRRKNPAALFSPLTLGVTLGYLPSVLANLVSSR